MPGDPPEPEGHDYLNTPACTPVGIGLVESGGKNFENVVDSGKSGRDDQCGNE
jgi:hypothetical protein